ncbi:hypothetical protein Q5741_15655 [Paenibacillus sp. JX-17]|uniref:Uncharacterized protein n=1 Tax=Paenibacillus lacisoli TaxID=3064525 RepID=A0ABT9CEZ2_9BACL|nr:hypothetical protein [Paenibacillus sp. JX-17]MDO7907847.1 hypothetical protein [Paenibacillus sp. JX-17]
MDERQHSGAAFFVVNGCNEKLVEADEEALQKDEDFDAFSRYNGNKAICL